MSEVFALLRDDGTLLYARPKGQGWAVSGKRPDIGPKGRKLCVFVSGADVLGLEARIPARNENEARKAAPFQVEDEIGESVDDVHVALGPSFGASGERVVQVVSQPVMDAWIAQLRGHGLDEASLASIHSVLPRQDGLYQAGDMVMGRVSGRTFELDAEIGADVFLGLENGTALPVNGAALAQKMGRQPAGEGFQSEELLLIQLSNWARESGIIDLRQGAFSPRRSVNLKGLARWRLAGGLVVALGLTWFVSVLAETQALNTRIAETENRTREFVQAGWPDANGSIEQVFSTLQPRSVSAGPAMPSVLTMTAVLYSALEQTEGSELRSIRYDQTRRQMTARIAFSDYVDIDTLTASMEEAGLLVRAGDARQSGGKIVGEINLEAKP